ncbi:MAG: peptidylprolyl isomerase [Candidatus Paceibacterota bacterium]
MKKLTVFILVVAVAFGLWLLLSPDRSDLTQQQQATTTPNSNNHISMTATIKTNKGAIGLAFFPDSAPNTVANFKRLVEEDFFQGVIFHRVIEGFMIQGGDPTGTGRGGPGYTFADELNPNSKAAERGYSRGTVAMANSGPDTNGSQFFIMHQDYQLPYNYTIFGYVTAGMEVVDEIATVETDASDRPLEEVVIEDIIIE